MMKKRLAILIFLILITFFGYIFYIRFDNGYLITPMPGACLTISSIFCVAIFSMLKRYIFLVSFGFTMKEEVSRRRTAKTYSLEDMVIKRVSFREKLSNFVHFFMQPVPKSIFEEL